MWKLMRNLSRNKGSVAVAVLLMLTNNVLSLVLPMLMQSIINDGVSGKDLSFIWRQGLQMLALSVCAMFAALAGSYFTAKVAMGFGRDIRQAIFYKVESLSQCDIDKIGTSSLITRSTNDARQVQDMVMMMLRIMINAPIMLVGGTIMALRTNAQLSSVLLVAVPIIAGVAVLVSKKVLPMFRRIQKMTDKLNQLLREKISGIRVIRAFNRSDYEDARFRESNLDLTGLALRAHRILAALIPFATFMLFFMILGLLALAAGQLQLLDPAVEAERLKIVNIVGDMSAFMVYLVMIIFSVVMAAALFVMLPRAAVSAKRINEVLETETDIREPGQEAGSGTKAASLLTGHLSFENVTFTYPGAAEATVRDISFEAVTGGTTAIIGGTGCGKSTLVNLIPRFYDVSGGRILLDGTDVREMPTHDLRQKIGFVPQQAFLFSGTVADNLRFGKEDATEAELWEALRIAQAAEFVEKLPNGLSDMISQSGKNLSGGQKQRLAIARAIIRRSEIYVFDDSFSALDYTTDAKLRKALQETLAGATLLIVAQRIGTILQADRIVVLDEGGIVGIGRHKELLQSCPTYREIALSQLPEEEIS